MYYGGRGATEPAVAKRCMENDLMEIYHWLPWEIDQIPYKRLQEILIIIRQKNQSQEQRAKVDEFKSKHMSSSRGSYTREL